jgi:hypothetical protein
VEVGRETTRLLAAVLGEERLGQLRAEGEAMDDDRAVVYTLDHIAEALTDSTAQHQESPTPGARPPDRAIGHAQGGIHGA